VAREPELELLAPVPLNIVNLRFRAPNLDTDALNALNRQILVRLQEDGIAVPSGTVIRGQYAIRVAITNHRSRDEDFDLLVRETLRLGRELLAAR
jgi:aromatic-L-amino-acid/L-tryptophan decarboxylase